MTDRRPLVVVRDEHLLDEVLRLAAAADCEVECAPDLFSARGGWAQAPVVILDEYSMTRYAPEGLPRRSAVMLVCPGEPETSTWQQAFAAGAEHVIVLPAEESTLIAVLADVAEAPSGSDGRVLAVIGGRGGGGSSVFAASVAVTAARAGDDAVLIDGDPLGGGIDLVLGAELDSGLRWPGVSLNSGRVSMSALWDALPTFSYPEGRLGMLSCARDGSGPKLDGVAAILDAGRRSGCTVVCDLPRELDASGWAVVDHADLVVLVVPAEVRACAAAKVLAHRLSDRAQRVGLVVRGPAPDALSADAVAAAVDLPLLAVMRAEPRLAVGLERAAFDPKPSGPLARGARAVLDELWSACAQPGAA
ncbi:MAG: septum site-determining protein Ssd [Haloechinothrix sp.]